VALLPRSTEIQPKSLRFGPSPDSGRRFQRGTPELRRRESEDRCCGLADLGERWQGGGTARQPWPSPGQSVGKFMEGLGNPWASAGKVRATLGKCCQGGGTAWQPLGKGPGMCVQDRGKGWQPWAWCCFPKKDPRRWNS